MGKCSQCEKPALYLIGPEGGETVPLCLDCWAKHEQIIEMQLERHERHLNFIADEMDANVGLPPTGPRFPQRPVPVQIGSLTLHNIKVSNSNVGVLNSGTLSMVDSAVTVIASHGEQQLAEALNELTTAVANSSVLAEGTRREALELLSLIATEVTQPAANRRRAAGLALVTRLREMLAVAADIASVTQVALPVIAAAFS